MLSASKTGLVSAAIGGALGDDTGLGMPGSGRDDVRLAGTCTLTWNPSVHGDDWEGYVHAVP